MVKASARNPFRSAAEKIYPHRVDIPLVEDFNRRRLDEMDAWCRAEFVPGAWEAHSFRDWSLRDRFGVPIDVLRYYFMEAGHAEQFRHRWLA